MTDPKPICIVCNNPIDDMEDAYYASKIPTHQDGFVHKVGCLDELPQKPDLPSLIVQISFHYGRMREIGNHTMFSRAHETIFTEEDLENIPSVAEIFKAVSVSLFRASTGKEFCDIFRDSMDKMISDYYSDSEGTKQ